MNEPGLVTVIASTLPADIPWPALQLFLVYAALQSIIQRRSQADTLFKARVIRAALDGQLPIRFADAGLERRRQALANGESTTQAKTRSKQAGVPPIGQPPPIRRNRLQPLPQARCAAP